MEGALLSEALMSDSDYKSRVQKATEKWSKKQLPKPVRKKPNQKPEAEFLLQLKKHLESLGWSMTIIEGKANYSESAGRYMSGAVAPGYPDLSGNLPNGIAAYIEVKARGRRSNVSPAQRDFLIGKISTNCFAIVCDSIEYFDMVFTEFKVSNNRKAMLLKELPPLAPRMQKIMDSDLDFDSE